MRKSDAKVVRKRVASETMGRMLAGNSTEDLDDNTLDALTTDDLLRVAQSLKALVTDGGMPSAGIQLVKVMEYIDRRADFKRQGIAAEECARLCINAIKDLKEKGYTLYDAPELISTTT